MFDHSAASGTEVQPEEGLFDIVVQLSAGSNTDLLRDKAIREMGMDAHKVRVLIESLLNGQAVRIGSSVVQKRAEKARDDFTSVGLSVTLTRLEPPPPISTSQAALAHPVESSFGVSGTDSEVKKAELVGSGSRDAIPKKIQFEQNTHIRKTPVALAKKIKMAIAFVGVAAVAFMGGLLFDDAGGFVGLDGSRQNTALSPTPGAQSKLSTASVSSLNNDLERILENLPLANQLDPTSSELLEEAALEESLVNVARGGGANAKGIPLDQALAALMVPVSSVGKADTSSVKPFVAAPLPPDFKALLSLEFADQLALMGQSARARGVVREIQTLPNQSPALAAAVQVSEVNANAWGLSAATADKSRKLIEAVRSGIAGLREPSDKSRAASAAAIAIAAQSRAPEQTAQAFLVLAAESAAQISDVVQKQWAADQLLVASGHVLHAGAAAAARAGHFERATDLATRLQNAAKQARSPLASAQLQAMLYLSQSVTSEQTASSQALDLAIAEASKASSLTDKAVALQAVGEIAGAAGIPSVLKALQALEPLMTQTTGTAKVQALSAISVAFASVGDDAKAQEMRRQIALAQDVPALEQQMEMAKALLRSDTSFARYQQKMGAYAQSENTIMRAASYLFAKSK